MTQPSIFSEKKNTLLRLLGNPLVADTMDNLIPLKSSESRGCGSFPGAESAVAQEVLYSLLSLLAQTYGPWCCS